MGGALRRPVWVLLLTLTRCDAVQHAAARSSAEDLPSTDVAQALDELWGGYTTKGIMLKIVECTLVPPWMWLHQGGLTKGTRLLDEERCLRHEMSWTRQPPPSSLLRWDLPDAMFRGGRWLTLSKLETQRSPELAGDVCGCHGHQISSSAIGLLLAPTVLERVVGAFAHDAATVDLDERAYCHKYNASVGGVSAMHYAQLRTDIVSGKYRGMLRKNPVRSSRELTCKMSSVQHMALRARAYARLRGKTSTRNKNAPQCLGLNSFYNQAHTSFGPSDITAVFYVNDTLTPTLLRGATMAETDRLVAAAKCAAARSYALAQRAAHMVMQIGAKHRVPPVVQYQFTSECFAAHSYLNRSSAGAPKSRPASWVLTPPPTDVAATCDPAIDRAALREAHALLKLTMARKKVSCACMGGLTPPQAHNMQSLHLQRIKAAEDSANAKQNPGAVHTLQVDAQTSHTFGPRDFFGVSQNFCAYKGFLQLCIRHVRREDSAAK